MSGGGSRRAILWRRRHLAAGAGQDVALNAKENFQRRPHPHAALLPAARGFWAVFDAIQNANFSDLLELEEAALSVTETNCWFPTYDAAKYMAPIIAEEKKRRIRISMEATATWQP